MQHWCRVLLGNPQLAATYTISVHTSRKGSAEQKTFWTKILMCMMHSLLGQNILTEFLPPLFLPLEIHHFRQALLSFRAARERSARGRAAGTTLPLRGEDPRSVGEDKVGLDDLTGFFQPNWFCVTVWHVRTRQTGLPGIRDKVHAVRGNQDRGGGWESELRTRVCYKDVWSSLCCTRTCGQALNESVFTETSVFQSALSLQTYSYAKETAGLWLLLTLAYRHSAHR